MKRSDWFGLWNNNENSYMISQPIKIESIKDFVDNDNFRLIVKKNKFYQKGSNKPYYCFAIGNCKDSAYNLITSKEMNKNSFMDELKEMDEEQLVQLIEEVTSKRLFTYTECQKIKRGACLDGQRGYDVGDLLIEDYV